MANPHRGEVELKAGGNTYTFRLTTNVLCEMEDHFDKTFNEVMADLSDKPSMKGLREVVRFALSENEPAPDAKQAGEIIDMAGSLAVSEALKKAIKVAFPDPESGESKNPPTASPKNGTGKNS